MATIKKMTALILATIPAIFAADLKNERRSCLCMSDLKISQCTSTLRSQLHPIALAAYVNTKNCVREATKSYSQCYDTYIIPAIINISRKTPNHVRQAYILLYSLGPERCRNLSYLSLEQCLSTWRSESRKMGCEL
ncbi:MAG: hypothetical protein MHMPM18_000981 [Marteilia pararefringens]